MTEPKLNPSTPSTFTTRRAEREAAEAAGVTAEPRKRTTIRAGNDAPQPHLEITSVRA